MKSIRTILLSAAIFGCIYIGMFAILLAIETKFMPIRLESHGQQQFFRALSFALPLKYTYFSGGCCGIVSAATNNAYFWILNVAYSFGVYTLLNRLKTQTH